jgi:DNA-binding XRE family transcriptional regulator
MKKTEAIKIFGNQSKLAKAVGISRQGINQWSNTLTTKQIDRVIGAATRLNIEINKSTIDHLYDYHLWFENHTVPILHDNKSKDIGFYLDLIAVGVPVLTEDDLVELFRREIRTIISDRAQS